MILLSVIRKILAIIMIRRTQTKLEQKIPISQAAYRSGRGTAEHVLALKLLADKAISSSDYEINILLLDMSKAFDTIERDTLLEDLKLVLDPDEVHMFYILLKDVEIKVKVESTIGKTIITNIGSPQGDSASAFLFIYYLAISLRNETTIAQVLNIQPPTSDHTYASQVIPPSDHTYSCIHKDPPEPIITRQPHADHSYSRQTHTEPYHHDQQYADDIGWAARRKHYLNKIKDQIPTKLKQRNLSVNTSKTEEYCIRKNGPEEWKKCKYLGSLLDTEQDINRRKGLAYNAFNKIKKFLTNKNSSIKNRVRRFEAFVSSIFLYNSELWCITDKIANKIDIIQRNFLRQILHIKLLDKIRNTEIYNRCNTQPWSSRIKSRRFKFLGHILRLHPETPIRKALQEYHRPEKRDPGKPPTTWWTTIVKDLKKQNISTDLTQISQLAIDRKRWRELGKHAMSN